MVTGAADPSHVRARSLRHMVVRDELHPVEPIAHVVNRAVLVLHGGVDGKMSLESLRTAPRPSSAAASSTVGSLLSAEPVALGGDFFLGVFGIFWRERRPGGKLVRVRRNQSRATPPRFD